MVLPLQLSTIANDLAQSMQLSQSPHQPPQQWLLWEHWPALQLSTRHAPNISGAASRINSRSALILARQGTRKARTGSGRAERAYWNTQARRLAQPRQAV